MLRIRRQKLVVWACLFAIWLGILMPTVSQSLKAAGTIQISNEICTTAGLTHAGPADDGQSSAPHADHWNACGYCTLLANSPPPAVSLPLLATVAAVFVHASPLLYDYIPPRPFRGRTHPLDPPSSLALS
ncbi:DUF2946 domain-containing protein [Collimonas sp.]|jgi:hypothetical protein|uniref:DUF2946 domain-containing protein n=1 Tax=Collimonas sp. TaxID=1963772 RepID=UPI002BB4B62A|nr:DUF2946 domain-containing protein [Collimonas sp.]HWW05308.1 DUF2946 domain-containing protein [Collimonas sp.]